MPNDKKTTFTAHAFVRVFERLHMSPEEVSAALDSDQCTPLGFEHRTDKMHLLFYSPDDDECFVAVRDEATREVITILLPNQDVHCRVPLEAKVHLRSLHNNKGHGHYTPQISRGINDAIFGNLTVFFKIRFKHKVTGELKTGTIKIPQDELPSARDEIMTSDVVHERLLQEIPKMFEDYTPITVSFSIGKSKGPFYPLKLELK
jgi:hypothetical protein